ncbi:hypothetical protein ASZ90_018038 [hydrocarbon metagenome]|uniref:Uncharacterized protein n=1 Tax=hydrocarbon metagenome TaxID=938273 RepID=A0A0W8E7Y2_9ZZZZ
MASPNYDLLLQIDEAVLNKSLAALYYSGFLRLEGEYNFVEGIPENLHDFTKFSYKIRMKNEPLIDLRGRDHVYIKFVVELKLIVLTGIVLEFDASFYADTQIVFDAVSKKMIFDLSHAEITNLYINDTYRFHKKFIENINEVLAVLLSAYLTEDRKTVEIPLILQQLELPMMPAGNAYELPVRMGDVLIYNNRLLIMGINFFTETAEDINLVQDMSGGNDLYINLKEKTLKQIFDFWWDNTKYEKCEEFIGSFPINTDSWWEKGTDILARLLSLGFIETKTVYDELLCNYNGLVKVLEKPDFEFCEENKVLINSLKIQAQFKASFTADVIKDIKLDTSSFIPDRLTPWEDDKLLKHREETKEILKLEQDLELSICQAEGIIKLNDKNNLVIEIVKADINIELGDKWYQNLSEKAVNYIIDLFEQKVLEKIPDLVISPNLILSKQEIAGYTMQVSTHCISFDNDELSLTVNIGINELMSKSVPVPVYIANKRTKKIHNFDCPAVEDIEMENRLGYYVLYEALKEGYSACKSCIGASKLL